MRRINSLKEGLELFRTLGSEVRMQLVTLLADGREMNMGELSAALGLTQGALTTHVRKLEAQGLIRVETRHSEHGLQKICSLTDHEILLNIYPSYEEKGTNVYKTEVQIGHFTDYAVHAGCGLLTDRSAVGTENDPRVFSYPERLDAQMFWFHDGYIEYRIPNLLPARHSIVQLTISLEMSGSELGSEKEVFSAIDYYLNGTRIGTWQTEIQSPSSTRGIYTPPWYNGSLRQHGYLKMLVINHTGIYIDGVRVPEAGVPWSFLDKNGEMRFRIETHPTPGHEGGVALYGNRFGNYNQNLQAIVHYMPESQMPQHAPV